ncbi:hypothetical protein ACOXXX_19520 [Thalassococcus sp. BH17M4-6]|uniref:hypothetical protein n=1 Tax=Thalassococcus sp. BH17M4-6 TaxID=3413148 RepID=UPI003BB9FEAE
MRTSIFSLVIAAAVFGAGFASAEQSVGTIQSLDDTARTVTLSDGVTYSFDDMTKAHEALVGFQVGDAVAINWDMVGQTHHARSIAPDFSAHVTGKVAAVDEAMKSVTLDNGVTYTFDNGSSKRTDLGGYRVGDEVSIVASSEGDMAVGHAIAPYHSAEVTGVVKSVDQAMHTVTLEDGQVYKFDMGTTSKTDLGGFRSGDKVSITVAKIGDTNWGRAISSANG